MTLLDRLLKDFADQAAIGGDAGNAYADRAAEIAFEVVRRQREQKAVVVEVTKEARDSDVLKTALTGATAYPGRSPLLLLVEDEDGKGLTLIETQASFNVEPCEPLFAMLANLFGDEAVHLPA